jgi:hypothetical protein
MLNPELANINFTDDTLTDVNGNIILSFCTKMFPWFLRLADFGTVNGDLQISDSMEQELFNLMRNYCNFYQSPNMFIGIGRYRKAPIDKLTLRTIISKGLLADDVNINKIDMITMADLNAAGLQNATLVQFLKENSLIINIQASR